MKHIKGSPVGHRMGDKLERGKTVGIIAKVSRSNERPLFTVVQIEPKPLFGRLSEPLDATALKVFGYEIVGQASDSELESVRDVVARKGKKVRAKLVS